jgi:small subunit ribosomal protein S17
MIGRVVSNKLEKTVTILVESRKTHPLYKKTYAWSKRYLVHDEMGAQMGDIVRVVKSRPFSKRKHWLVTKILGRDIVPMSEEALKAESEEAIAEVMLEEKETASAESSGESKEEAVEAAVEIETAKPEKQKAEKKAAKVKKVVDNEKEESTEKVSKASLRVKVGKKETKEVTVKKGDK